MSRKHKNKHHTIVIGNSGAYGGLFGNYYDDYDDYYDDCCYVTKNTTKEKKEKVVPDFELCPVEPLLKRNK